MRQIVARSLCILMPLLQGACGQAGDAATAPAPDIAAGPALLPVILQTDWYPQPEHAGFYYARHAGYYREAGLEVDIRPGANFTNIPQLVATNRVQFAVGTSDNMIMAISRGIPLLGLFPYFQHDPQCVMFHQSSGIRSLSDLDGRTVMLNPAAAYVQYLQKTLGIRLQLIPLDYSLARFLGDPQFVQQCFVTSEPYYVAKQGVEPGVLPLSSSGFDPYRLVYTNQAFAQAHPDQVRGFVEASLRGWRDYMASDGQQTHAEIGALNSQQSMDYMAWTKAEMQRHSLVSGYADRQEALGLVRSSRLREHVAQLQALDLLGGPVDPERVFALEHLPEALVQP